MEKNTFDDFIRELNQKNDIVSVASKYVTIERRGRYYWCRCPFHGEKTPSLCLNDIDNFFYCFGCHKGGSSIQFVMNIESIEFMDAVRMLAEWAGMEVPESFSGSNKNVEELKKRKDRLYAVMKDTARHYYENLSAPEALPAKEYMKKRQLDSNLATKFGLGYSKSSTDIVKYLQSLGYTEDEIISSGVAKKRDNKVYDPLSNRLIFPIIDVYGKVIAFGGRTLEAHPDFAKYINTQDTDIFNKRYTLYAINYLKKQKQQGPIPYVIVVEGYMDTISLHKAGFTMAIASMGTALTKEQAKMIKRFCDKAYICYDGDSPGQAATLRGLDILRENDLDVMVMQLPDGFDPDDVIKTYGKEGYQKIIDEALPLIEFKIKYLKTKFDMKSVDGRAKYLTQAIDVLSKVSNSVERELYIPMVSEIASTNVDFIREEVDKKISGNFVDNEIEEKFKVKQNVATIPLEIDDEKDLNPVIIKAEKYVLYSLIHSKPYANFKTDVTYLFTGKRKEIFKTIILQKQNYFGTDLVQMVFEKYSGGDNSVIADIINYGAESAEDEANEKKYYFDCLKVIYENHLKKKLNNLTNEYSNEIDKIKRKELSEKMIEISLKLKNKNVEEL